MVQRSKDKLFEFPSNFLNLYKNLRNLYFKPSPEVVTEDQIIIVKKLFNGDLCNELIKKFEALKLETTPLIKSKEYAARVNDRLLLNDPNASENLWNYLQDILLQDDYDENIVQKTFQHAIGLNPQLRVYRYQKGHYFGKHFDDSVDALSGKTGWTLLIYLTGDDEFDGGGTIFYPDTRGDPLNIHPSKGMALLHKHGDDCLMHEAEIVKNGYKWVLRSDIVF